MPACTTYGAALTLRDQRVTHRLWFSDALSDCGTA